MKYFTRIMIAFLFVFFFVSNSPAGESATVDEVYGKLVEAANALEIMKEDLDAWKKAFNDPQGDFVWKDSYVWVINHETLMNETHPYKPKIVGVDLSGLQCKKTGSFFFKEFCEAADNPNGKWVEYWWPKPGEDQDKLFRKLSCVIPVKGTPYLVVAGIYNEDASLDELNAKLK